MSLKAYTVGSEFPPLKPGVLRLYSMRFCPYSQRVRLVLEAKKIKYETININMKKRPEWYSEVNPAGLVPAIQHDDGRVILESMIICDYLDSIYPDVKLFPTDPYEKAKTLMLIDGFQRVIALLFKVLKIKDADAFNEISKVLENYEKLLKEDYFGGKKASIIDYMIWPWFERFRSLSGLINNELDKAKLPAITKWVSRMLGANAAVKATHTVRNQMIEFYKVSLTNQEPDYDIGLEEDVNGNGKAEADEEEAEEE